MIEITGLSKSYGKTPALQGVELVVRPGLVTGLAGPNGCGKSTLIKSILGLVSFQAGKILVAGQSLADGPGYRRSIGYLPQNPDFPANLRIRELFGMIEDVRGARSSRREELIARFELGPLLDRHFGILSGGSKQKVAAVLAFLFDSPILILDEPTVGLDPISASRLKELARERAAGGATVLLVSHIMSEMEQLAEQMSFLLDGRVKFSGSVRELRGAEPGGSLEAAVVRLMGGAG